MFPKIVMLREWTDANGSKTQWDSLPIGLGTWDICMRAYPYMTEVKNRRLLGLLITLLRVNMWFHGRGSSRKPRWAHACTA